MLALEILLGVLGGAFVVLVFCLFVVLTVGGRGEIDVACKGKKVGGKKG